MREAIAFVRQDYLTTTSYRSRTLFGLIGIVVSLVPVYFIAQALQPVMAASISSQGRQYFAFLLVGLITQRWLVAGVNALPEALGAAVRSGTIESIFVTPVSLSAIVTGMIGYKLLWTTLESSVMVVVGLLFGVTFDVGRLVPGLLVLFLITLAHVGIGIVGGALILVFRTTGPLLGVVVLASTLLGGVFYPTHIIPSWIQRVSSVIPLTYGLRALRRTFLEGASLSGVWDDVLVLSVFTIALLALGFYSLALAVRYARQAGTLAQY